MAFKNSFLVAAIIGFVWLILCQNVQSKPVTAGDVNPSTYSAGFVGSYAGQQVAAQALNDLYSKQHAEQRIADEKSHDFSEGAAENNPSLYETLGSLGDHLKECQFPHDYGHDDDDKGTEYEEADAQAAAASEQHEAAEEHYEQALHENDVGDFDSADLHSHDLDEFYSKPVPGIDHGKGAYSYSTTYEFKEPQQ